VTGGWLGNPTDSNQENDMSDQITVPGQTHDNAVLLLEAAQALELPAGVVLTVEGGFSVPSEVAEKAGFDEEGQPKSKAAKEAAKDAPETEEVGLPEHDAEADPAGTEPQKKTAAKKTAAPKAGA
jgi:hypothetical protein